MVSGQAFAPDGKTPVNGIDIYAYNTDAEGYYGEHHAEYPPRIYGWMRTDADGRFAFETVFPGHYPGMAVAAHVHFAAAGAGYPPQGLDELQFEGDQYLSPAKVAEDAARGEFRCIRPLETVGGKFHAAIKLRLRTETNFRA